MTTIDLMNETICDRDGRRAAVLEHPTLNGIDFVEFFEQTAPAVRQWLVVTFLKNAPPLAGLPERFSIEGGVRIVGIRATAVAAGADATQLEVDLSAVGDFSTYRLTVDSLDLDEALATIAFTFKASCPTPFDCRQEEVCTPEDLDEPALDYLAKDYASFRRLLLDFAAQRNPHWTERNPADVGVMLAELLAYTGDRLSYFQDAVATEAYLDTCRQRVSAKRHARLIDYRMHDGRNAWTYAQLRVTSAGSVARGTRFMTRVGRPLIGQQNPPGVAIDAADLAFDSDPALRDVVVFESTAAVTVAPEHNELTIHTWSDEECCLPMGATSVALYAIDAGQAVRPTLAVGDFLLFEEVKGAETGKTADLDSSRRQVVRITKVEPAIDRVYRDVLTASGALQPVTAAAQPVLPLLKVTWSDQEPLQSPFCVSARRPETGLITAITVARGNVVPCDHGRAVTDALTLTPPPSGSSGLHSLEIPRAPLTFQAAVSTSSDLPHLAVDRFDLDTPAEESQPAIELDLHFTSGDTETWLPVDDLLDDNAFGRHFVVDIDNNGAAKLRFGDDEYGRRPDEVDSAVARYRIGNGRSGNIGAGSLVHVSPPTAAIVLPGIDALWQPLAATGGVDAQTIEEVRQLAPAAFRAEQFRAVTEADYEAAAMKVEGVGAAKCVFRWTGSWRTVFVAIHPSDPSGLVIATNGRSELRADLASAVLAKLRRYKLAGYDLEVRAAQYVPIRLELRLCVARGHFRGDVLQAVMRTLSNRRYGDGTVGFFHPSKFVFGSDVYLSKLYEAIQDVTGVDSVEIQVFRRYWSVAADELETGVLAVGDDEIARLDNDPNFAENGVLLVTAVGGS